MNNIYLLSLKTGEPATAEPAPVAAPPGAPGGLKPAVPDVTPTSLAADEDAYKGKISHVVLFNATSNSPTSVVGQSVLDSIMNSSGTGAGGLPGMAPGGSASMAVCRQA